MLGDAASVGLLWLLTLAGVVAFFRTRRLREQINRMSAEIMDLRTQIHQDPLSSAQTGDKEDESDSVTAAATDTPPPLSDAVQERENANVAVRGEKKQNALAAFFRNLKQHWMVWVGGLSIGLAGIFLVKFSIDKGWLGPLTRILLAIAAGIVMHAVAELLRRKWGQHDALAALSGGASITLYAAFLASLMIYSLFPAKLVFAALALTSMGTMLLATVHGPVLAAIGLLGAYVVPVLVPLNADNARGLLIYGFVVSAAGLVLTRYVYRHWLWFGVLAGIVFTWLLSYINDWLEPTGARWIYVAAIGWALVAIRDSDFSLLRGSLAQTEENSPGPWRSFLCWPRSFDARNLFALVGLIIMCMVNTIVDSVGEHWFWALSLMPVVLFLICWNRPQFAALPWLSLLATTLGLLVRYIDLGLWRGGWPVIRWFPLPPELSVLLAKILLWLIVLYSGLAAWRLLRGRTQNRGVWSSLLFLTPVWLLVVACLILPATISDQLWKPALVLGLVYMAVAIQFGSNAWSPAVMAALLLASHAAYSVAVSIVFDQASITLALAAQVVTLSWLRVKYPEVRFDWAIKALLVIIIIRLSLNPFLLNYPVDSHWPLWTIGGSLVFVIAAMMIAGSGARITAWLTGTAMHLGLLLASSQIRYWLYEGDVFSYTFSLTEASLHTMVWGTMGLVYLWREGHSESLGWLYRLASTILLSMALTMYVIAQLVAVNPIINSQSPFTTPIFNILLVAYGVPMLLFMYAYRFTRLRSLYLGWAVALSAIVFSIMEIRHIWQPQMHFTQAIDTAEQYTYSAVWLVMAIGAILFAIRVNSTQWYRGGAAMLLFVTAKIFLVDMSDLTGLFRVLSFLGLGLGLLAVAYLHQKMSPESPHITE